MKMHLDEYVRRFVEQTKPLMHGVSRKSVERMLRDDRLWPVDLWMKSPQENGPGRLQRWQIHPDPCDPGHDRDPMVREWRIARMEGADGGVSAARECPEEIMGTCDRSDQVVDMLAKFWEIDNGKELPNRPPPGETAPNGVDLERLGH